MPHVQHPGIDVRWFNPSPASQPAATPHPQGGVKIMDSLADRRIDAGAAESLWVMAPKNGWLGSYFHVGQARPPFRSFCCKFQWGQSLQNIIHPPKKVTGLHEGINQWWWCKMYAGRTPPTLCKSLIFGSPVCRIPKIDPIWLAHIFSKVLVVERPPTIEKTSWDSENWVVLETS